MKYLLAVALLWAVVATVGGECARRNGEAYEARAQRAEGQAQNWVNLATTDSTLAVLAFTRAGEAMREAQTLRIALAHAKATVDSAVDTVLVQAPAECASVVELLNQYQGLYGQQEAVVVALSEAHHQDSIALGKRTEETRHLRLALDTALAVLANRPKPHKWLGLLPKPNLHAGYGLTLWQGRVVSGAQVGVSFPIRW